MLLERPLVHWLKYIFMYFWLFYLILFRLSDIRDVPTPTSCHLHKNTLQICHNTQCSGHRRGNTIILQECPYLRSLSHTSCHDITCEITHILCKTNLGQPCKLHALRDLIWVNILKAIHLNRYRISIQINYHWWIKTKRWAMGN